MKSHKIPDFLQCTPELTGDICSKEFSCTPATAGEISEQLKNESKHTPAVAGENDSFSAIGKFELNTPTDVGEPNTPAIAGEGTFCKSETEENLSKSKLSVLQFNVMNDECGSHDSVHSLEGCLTDGSEGSLPLRTHFLQICNNFLSP